MSGAEEAQTMNPLACPCVSISPCEVPVLGPSGGSMGKDSFHHGGSRVATRGLRWTAVGGGTDRNAEKRQRGRVGRAEGGRGGGAPLQSGRGSASHTDRRGRHGPAHLFGPRVLRWAAVGGQSGEEQQGGGGAVFLESFVCVGVHTCSVCVCECRLRCAGTCVPGKCVWHVCACATVSPG